MIQGTVLMNAIDHPTAAGNALEALLGKTLSAHLLIGLAGDIGVTCWPLDMGARAYLHLHGGGPADAVTIACNRLGVVLDVETFDGPLDAELGLDETLAAQGYAIVWADPAALPGNGLPERAVRWLPPAPVVVTKEKHSVVLKLTGTAGDGGPIEMETLTAARAVQRGLRFRQAVLKGSPENDIAPVLLNAIQETAGLYTQPREPGSGLPALRAWSEQTVDRRGATGWPKFLATDRRLLDTLSSTYRAIMGPGGVLSHRRAYAAFLEETEAVLDRDLGAARQAADHSATAWRLLAEELLPDGVSAFEQFRAALEDQFAALRAGDAAGIRAGHEALEGGIDVRTGLTDGDRMAIFQRVYTQIRVVQGAERGIADALGEI